MERERNAAQAVPDFASLHPGYFLCEGTEECRDGLLRRAFALLAMTGRAWRAGLVGWVERSETQHGQSAALMGFAVLNLACVLI
jgi:hypothetical protein